VWSRSGNTRVDDLFKRGVSEMNAERFREAIATFTRSSSSSPISPRAGTNARRPTTWRANTGARSRIATRLSSATRSISARSRLRPDLPAARPAGQALEYFRRALAVNPNLDGVQSMVQRLEELEARRRARSI